MREIGTAAFAAGVAWLALAGGAALAADQPVRGGTLTQVVLSEPPTFDCHATATSYVMQLVAPSYSTLLKFDMPNYPKIVGDLADSWTISPDGLTYTFKLHPNVHFHDGEILTANDIKASYDRLRDPPAGIVSQRKSQLVDIASVTVDDPLTVSFHLSSRNSAMLINLASPWNCIYSAKMLAQDPNYPATHVMGTGPFVFKQYDKGQDWVATRFDDYFRPGHPYLDEVRSVFLNGAGAITALAGGQIDADLWTVSPPDVARIKASRGDKTTISTSPLDVLGYFSMNTNKPPFNDVRVRQALLLSMDRHEALQALTKITGPAEAGAFIRPHTEYAFTDAELAKEPGFGTDMAAARAKARQLLAEAGQTNLHVTIESRNLPGPWEVDGVYLIDALRQIGVQADQVRDETGLYFSKMQSGDYTVAIEGFNWGSDDPNEVLLKFLPGNPLDYGVAKDDVLTQLYNQQKAEPDEAKRRALVIQYQERMLDQAYIAPLSWGQRATALASDVHGWAATPSFVVGIDLADVWRDPAK